MLCRATEYWQLTFAQICSKCWGEEEGLASEADGEGRIAHSLVLLRRQHHLRAGGKRADHNQADGR